MSQKPCILDEDLEKSGNERTRDFLSKCAERKGSRRSLKIVAITVRLEEYIGIGAPAFRHCEGGGV